MKRLLILGMGRSGTTFITELLAACGVYLGAVNWAFEHEGARAINDGYLAQHCGARRGLPYGRLPPAEIEPGPQWQAPAAAFVARMDGLARAARRPYWTFKDPRSTVLHRLWADYFDAFVGMFRAPQQVVASYLSQKWITGWDRRKIALAYWKRFNQSLLCLCHACTLPAPPAREAGGEGLRGKPFFMLDYNAPMLPQVEALCRVLDLPLTPAARALYNPRRNHFNLSDLPRDRQTRAIYEALLSTRMIEPQRRDP
ncbi:MAG: hypothetical protein HY784_11490 [Chloroflexi bacterium]|nr:hypothetical protein [Chloroflexota bacterium]